jgi:predicted MFS family arabinose efflux permease
MLLSFLVMGIGLLMWAFSSSFWDLTLSLVLLGSAHGSTYPIATRHIADSVSREKTVGAFTVCLLIDDAVSLAGAPLLGLIAELFGLSSLFLTLEVPVLGIGLGYTVMMRRALTQNIGG